MKNKLLAAIFAASFLCFAGCSVSDSVDSEYSKWTFSGTVIDSENGQGLGNVVISYQDSDGDIQTVKTDASGNFFIKELPYGSLNFSFNYKSIKGKDTLYYTPKVINIGSSGESSRMEGVVAGTALIVRLSPLNATLSGEFYITEESTDKKIPVSKTKLHLMHQDTAFVNLDPDSFEAKTDSLGRFTFKGLPADTGLILSIDPFTYNGLRYIAEDIELPRLKSKSATDMGRIYLTRDTLIAPVPKIKSSNVMDKNGKGLENVSQQAVPYYVFNEKISSSNLSVTVMADTNVFTVVPEINQDTLFLNHNIAFPPAALITVKIVAYGKKSGERIEIELSNDSAFKTKRGIYAVTSNTWPSNEKFKASFGIQDTMWVKFSKKLAKNTDRIQWNYTSGVDCTIYGNGYYANANTWINKDTLFVQMLQDILVNRDRGDSVGMNITVYAYDGSYIDSFILRTELIVPKDTLSNTEGTEENSGNDEDADDEDDNLDTPLDD